MKRPIYFLAVGLILLSMGACVPSSKFNALKEDSQDKIEQLKEDNLALNTKNNELDFAIGKLSTEVAKLRADTTNLGKELRNVKEAYSQLQETYKMTRKQNDALKSGKTSEMRALLQELNTLKEGLLSKEDKLNNLESALDDREQRLKVLQEELMNKEQRLIELESVLQRQDSLVSALKTTISEALFSFKGEGLTVEQKNGKVYLSLQEKLLFSSGSWNVETRGKEAIKQIAGVLEKNKEIDVMVEGHTDKVPYNGTGPIKDNWDLSVKRATSIVRIIIENSSIAPSRLTAAGRGSYVPVASNENKEGRSKNRRTEIVLTPDLSELYSIIEQN